jgi:septal ring-binding cell division protein DamX
MARGDTPHLDGEPDSGPASQREILAQFEAAIAGMRTREIQIGLRQLLAGTVPPPQASTEQASTEPASTEPASTEQAGPAGGEHAEGPGPVAERDDRPHAERHGLDEQ